jgi:hypothetical protein
MAIVSKTLTGGAVVTAPKQRIIGRPFQPGQSGNPAGRPRSSRSRHSENFLAAFANDFELHGAAVIEKVRTESPAIYLKIAADLLPKESVLDIDVDVTLRQAVDVATAFRVLAALPKTELIELRKNAVETD